MSYSNAFVRDLHKEIDSYRQEIFDLKRRCGIIAIPPGPHVRLVATTPITVERDALRERLDAIVDVLEDESMDRTAVITAALFLAREPLEPPEGTP